MYTLFVNNGENPFPSVTVVVVCCTPVWILNSGKCANFFLLSVKYVLVGQMKPPTYHQMDATRVVLEHFERLWGDYVA